MFEIGLTSFAEAPPEPVGGKIITHGERLRNVVSEIVKADQVGLDVYGLGEHHRIDMAASAPAITLAAAAAKTEQIRLSSAVIVLSSADPVRTFQDFSTLDLISSGRAELLVGRGSFIESFPLFGQSLEDYNELFAEKLDLLVQIRDNERVTWSGQFRAPLDDQAVYPRPQQDPLPIWVGVGGTPASIVRAAKMGLPVALAIIGGDPVRFRALASLYRRTLAESGFDPGAIPLAVHGLGRRTQPVAAALVAIDDSRGQQARQRHPQRVLRDPEERPRSHQGTHGHGSPPHGGEEVEDQTLGSGAHGAGYYIF